MYQQRLSLGKYSCAQSPSIRFEVHSLFVLGLFVISCFGSIGCRRYRDDLDYSFQVEQTWKLDDESDEEFVQFASVFWEPDDTLSLRERIVDDQLADGRDVLEIGTGTGLLAVLSLLHGAKTVVATDINPAAVANAKYNAAMLVPDASLDVRSVPPDRPGAFEVVEDTEKFDLIISNPPWEDGDVTMQADHAYFDSGFALMDSILDGLPKHLRRNGRCLLVYGHVPAIKRLQRETATRGYEFKVLDDREIDSLPQDFLPGMLIEIRIPLDFGN